MFYTPKHCCECGEKLDRGGRNFLASRFCETCEGEFKIQDWAPRGVLVLSVILAVFGVGSFLKKSDKPINVVTTSVGTTASNKIQNVQNSQLPANGDVQTSAQKTAASVADQPETPTKESNRNAPQAKANSPEKPQNSAAETVYFCGAQTKKGTPCTRRVKGGGRCWQHTEQPAMLPPEKLVASR